MSIVTKTGDGGTTGRFGGGRISKSNPRIEAIGSVDELNSSIGLMSARTDLGDDVLVDLKLNGFFVKIHLGNLLIDNLNCLALNIES